MIEAMKQALEALETPKPLDDYPPILNTYAKTINNAITSLRQAIKELESQELVAWDLADKVRQDLDRKSCPDAFMRIAVESIVKHHPPQRKPLTNEQIDHIYTGIRAVHHDVDSYVLCREIEAAHGIKE